MAEIVLPVGQALLAQGVVQATLAGTGFNINVSNVPQDEALLVLLANETASIAARIGFGTSNLNSAPALQGQSDRYMVLTAAMVGQLAAKPASGSGVAIGYQVFRAAR